MTHVQRITPDDWQAWRALRRRALAEDPGAFAASTAVGTGDDDAEPRWRDRISGARACFLAHRSGGPVGMVAADPGNDGVLVLASMWVAPEVRGEGVGRALVDAVLSLADGAEVRLRVIDGNRAALAVYAAAGFELEDTPADDEGCRGMLRPADLTP